MIFVSVDVSGVPYRFRSPGPRRQAGSNEHVLDRNIAVVVDGVNELLKLLEILGWTIGVSAVTMPINL